MKPNARWGAVFSALAVIVLAAMLAIALTVPELVWDASNGPAPSDPNLPEQRARAAFVFGLDMVFVAFYLMAFLAAAAMTRRKPVVRVIAIVSALSLAILDGAENLAGLVRLGAEPLLDFSGALAPTILTAGKWAVGAVAIASVAWLMPKRGYLTAGVAAVLGLVYPVIAAMAAWNCFQLGEGAAGDPFYRAAVLGLGPGLISLALWFWAEARRAL